MTGKEYLNGIRRQRLHCMSLHERLLEIENQMYGMKAIVYNIDRVQVSPSNRMEEVMVKLESIATRYVNALDKYHKAIEKAYREIDAMPNEMYREVLTLRYMQDDTDGRQMSIEKISCIMHRSFDWVRHLHGNALKEFERMYL